MNRFKAFLSLDHPAALLRICLLQLVLIEVLRFTHLIRIP